MTDFEQFIKGNNILKKDVAKYLGISNAFVTQLCDGRRSVPNDKLALLKRNPFGWDVSMLQASPSVHTNVSGNGKANVQVGNNNKIGTDARLAELEKENALLKEQLAEEKARSAQYWETIQSLIKK